MSITLTRDQYGRTPLYWASHHDLFENRLIHGTTIRECLAQGARGPEIKLLPPGGTLTWDPYRTTTTHPGLPAPIPWTQVTRAQAAAMIRHLLVQSASLQETSHPAALMLSGGIDSSALAVALKEAGQEFTAYHAWHDPASPDLKAARMVAAHLGLELREVQVTQPTMGDLLSVINLTEHPDKTQLEIGWPHKLLAKAMADDGIRVCYTGEGADELFASHGFAWKERQREGAPDWHVYRQLDLRKQHNKNLIREWKIPSAYGIEPRHPFLYTPLVDTILSLPEEICCDRSDVTKVPIQEAFRGDLPEWITTRRKIGFQDALGIKPTIAATLKVDTVFQVRAWTRATYASLFPGVKIR